MRLHLTVLAVALAFAAQAHAIEKGDGHGIEQCKDISAQCEAAHFEPGMHKKNKMGLWVDCVGKVAKGETVAGVTATKDQAQACLDAKKAKRAEHKAAKKA
jgi:hypothetical protein